MRIRVGVVFEDSRFSDFVKAALARLGEPYRLNLVVVDQAATNGCNRGLLKHYTGQFCSTHELVIVAADSAGPTHSKVRRLTHRQKAARLRDVVKPDEVSIAVADPSVEAWLMADPQAMVEGLTDALGLPFRTPTRWPSPRTEREAKHKLGLLIEHGVGSPLTRAGFEFADEIVSRADLRNSPNASLRDWARDIDGRLQRIVRMRGST